MLARYLRQVTTPVRYAISTAPEDLEAVKNYLALAARARGIHSGSSGLHTSGWGVLPHHYRELPPEARSAHEAFVEDPHPANLMALIDLIEEHEHTGDNPLRRLWHELQQNRGPVYQAFSAENLSRAGPGMLRTAYAGPHEYHYGNLNFPLNPLGPLVRSLMTNLQHNHPTNPVLPALEHSDRQVRSGDVMALPGLHDTLIHGVEHLPMLGADMARGASRHLQTLLSLHIVPALLRSAGGLENRS